MNFSRVVGALTRVGTTVNENIRKTREQNDEQARLDYVLRQRVTELFTRRLEQCKAFMV